MNPPSLTRGIWPVAVLLPAMVALAWWNRFVQDDAFVTFRYSRNLALGHGLVFNPGEKVEGYTNFLWALLMAVPHALNWDVVPFAMGAGLVAYTITLFLVWHLGVLLFPGRHVGLLAVLLLGTNYSFSAYATGGLETSFQTMWFVSALWITIKSVKAFDLWSRTRLIALSLVIACALMTRLDSALLVGPLGLFALWCVLRTNSPPGRRIMDAVLLILPGGIPIVTWFVWKWEYYGGILPNTYYIKVAGGGFEDITRGFYYISVFSICYAILPFIFWWLIRAKRLGRDLGAAPAVMLGLPIILWLAYVVKIGGDFNEFRFIIPMMPALFILIATSLILWVPRAGWRFTIVTLLVIVSIIHAATFDHSPLKLATESISDLTEHLYEEHPAWVEIGQELGTQLESPERVKIALGAAGAVPYYSKCEAIEMFGLNDQQILQNGLTISKRAGYRRMATLSYLIERDTNLIIGRPQPTSTEAHARGYYELGDLGPLFILDGWPGEESLPEDTRVVEIPLPSGDTVIALYVRQNQVIDEAIQRHGWRVMPVLVYELPEL